MIKIIPYENRKLTLKNLAKIWNLFPNEEFCVTGIIRNVENFKWVKTICKSLVVRGKDFSVEIDPVKYSHEVENLLKIGVRKFYFPWHGIDQGLFFSSSDILQYAISIIENYEDAFVTIVYTLPYELLYHPPDFDLIETSIIFLGRTVNSKNRLHGLFRRPHPWYGEVRIQRIQQLEKLALEQGNFDIEDACGCLTITPNTNFYCCPFCVRKKRKKLFGNADRDKQVIGTIDRGFFRECNCNKCAIMPNAKKRRKQYNSRG